MKEQNYKKHIGLGVKLDKLQEGDFNYDNKHEESGTLSEFAKTVRDDICKGNNKPESVTYDTEYKNPLRNITINEFLTSDEFIDHFRVDYKDKEVGIYDTYDKAKASALEMKESTKSVNEITIITVRKLDTVIERM